MHAKEEREDCDVVEWATTVEVWTVHLVMKEC